MYRLPCTSSQISPTHVDWTVTILADFFPFPTIVQAFTLDSVPPAIGEVAAGAIALNFVSRDLLEARDLDDAMHRVCSPGVSIGHCYNLMDVRARRIVTVETASRNRFAVQEAGPVPSFHANMYRHLQVEQVDMISTAQQALE